MKNNILSRIFAVAVSFLSLMIWPAQSQVLLEENFTFTGPLTSNGWTAFSGGGTAVINAAAPGLTYPNLPSSGVGNAANLTASGEDLRKPLSSASTSGDLYTSFLVNVSSATAAGDYFYSLYATSGGYFGRVFARSSGTGFQIGISKNSTTVAYDTTELALGTTYLVVVKLTRNPGTGDDVAGLWVNPALGGPETAALVSSTSGGDPVTIDNVALRQGSSTPVLRVGSILAGTTWASVTPSSSASAPVIASFTPTSGQVGASVTINGSNFGATPAVRFNGIAAFSSVNPAGTQITATVPSGATSGPISVEVAGEPVATSGTNFTVLDPLAPTVSTGGTMTAFSTEAGTASSSQSFTVSGSNLLGDVTVTAPTGFEVSANNTTFGSTASLVPTGGTLSAVPVYVRISAAALAGAVSGNVTVSATGAITQNVAASGTVTAGISYISLTSTNANSYLQNFNNLGTTTVSGVISATSGVQTSLGAAVNSGLNGWYAAKIRGSGTSATGIVANDGSANSGAVYNYGSTNTAGGVNLDRSLGALASGSTTPGFGALIKNDTTNTLTGLSITLTAKFWRSSTTSTNVLTFGYGRIDGTNTTATNFITATNGVSSLPELNVVGPAPVGANAALDGNDPANQRSFNGIVVPVSLAPGQSAFIRWQDFDETGSDAGLAIDDFLITAVAGELLAPEFDLPAGVYLTAQTVRVSNFATYGPGVEVRYTLDGSTPGAGSLLYNNTTGISIAPGNGTITLRAIAINTGSSATSSVSSAAYSMPKDVANLTALRASPTGSTIYRVTGEVTFTAGTSFRNTKFFQDAGAGIQVDDTAPIITTTYVAGDNVQNIMGRISTFNGQLQMVPIQDFGAPVSTGNIVTPLARTIDTLSNADQAMLVTMPDVQFEQAGTPFGAGGSTTPITDPSVTGFTGLMRNIFGESNITGSTIPSGPNTLTGIVQSASVSSVLRLTVGPRSLSDIVFTGTPALSIQSNKSILNAGGTGETEEATVTISRTGATDQDLVIDLTEDSAGAFAADVDGSLIYTPLPTTVTIPAGSSSATIYVVALPSPTSFTAAITVSAGGFQPASQTFSVQGSEAPVPAVEVTGAEFSAFSTVEATPSTPQTVSVSGSNLTGDLTVTAPAGFAVSSDGLSYASSVVLSPVSGAVSATTISVRLTGAAAGSFSGNVSFASAGASTQDRAVSGTVTAAPPPSGPIAITPGASVTQNFATLSTNAIATLPGGWKVDKNTTVRTVGTYAAAGTATEIAGGVNLTSGASNGIYNFGSSPTDRAVGGLSSSGGSRSVNLYVALQNTSGTAISGLSLSYNAERYRNGSNPAGFSIQLYYSTDGTTWTSAGANFLSSFAANADNNGAAIVPIETLGVTSQSLPVAVPAGSTLYLAWNYSVTSGTTTSSAQAIGVSDIEITAAGENTPVITSISPTSGAVGATVTITGSNFGATPAVRFNGIAAASSVNGAGTEITATVPSGATTGPITVEVAGQATATSPVNFTVVDPSAPTLSTSGTLTAFNTIVGTPSTSQSFTVSGANLTGNATITAPAGFEVSSNDSTFGPTATLATAGGTLTDVPVYVRIAASAPAGAVSGNVTVAATGATTQNVPASGAVNAVPTFITLTTTAPNSYTQNFDSLGTATISNVVSPAVGVQTSLGGVVANTLDGWYAGKIAGTGTSVTGIVANDGSSGTGAVYNYGSTNEPSNADRSLGSLASGTLIPGFGALIKNETGQTLTTVQISFTAKFWRSSTGTNNVLTFGYGLVGASGVTTGNFLSASNAAALPAADVVGPAPVATNGPLDGNDPANQVAFNNVAVPVSLAPGETMFIRWQDANEAGSDAGLAIDNVSITAVASGASPVVTVTGLEFGPFSTTVGTPSSPQTVSVSGSNLAGNLTITPPAGYQVSSDGIAFSSSLSLTPVGGSIAATTISVRLSGAAAGSFSGDVSFASTGATTQTRPVSGSVTSAYDAWASGFGLDPATNGAPTADPDGDSFTNEQEYAFGTSPIVANGALLTTGASGGNLVVTWLERSDVTYNVQSTANLATTAFANDGSVTVQAGPAEPTPPAGYTRKQFSVPTTGRKFYRVSATVPNLPGGASTSGGTLLVGGPAPGGGELLLSNPPLTTEGAGTITLGSGTPLETAPSTDSGTTTDFGSSTLTSGGGTLPEGFDPTAGSFTIGNSD